MDLRSKLRLKTEYWLEERWLRWSLFLSGFCSRRSRWNFWILGQILKETLPSSFCQLKYFVLKTPQNMQSYCFGAFVSMLFSLWSIYVYVYLTDRMTNISVSSSATEMSRYPPSYEESMASASGKVKYSQFENEA